MKNMGSEGVPPTTPGAGVDIPGTVLGQISSGAWLTSWWVAAIAITAGLAITVTVLWGLSHWRRRRAMKKSQLEPVAVKKRRRWGRVSVLTATWVGVIAVVGNVMLGAMPNLTNLMRQAQVWAGSNVNYSTAAGSRVQMVDVPGDRALDFPDSVAWVYTPPGYDPTSNVKYPVAYLMHGTPGRSSDWFLLGRVDVTMDALIGAGLMKPMIVVAPDVNGGPIRDIGCVNVIDGPKVESWLYGDLIPFIDRSYSTQASRSGRVIGGMSAGGYCTLNQGLRHPDVWGAMLAFEPYGDPGVDADRLLGADPAKIAAQSPSHYLPTMTFTHPMPAYLDVGSRSRVAEVRGLAQQLVDRDQTVLFRINQGHGHTWGEVRAGVPYALVFASRELAAGG